MNLTFGSGCSGIDAASVAWNPLGWKAQWFAEIDAFPSAVLKHHYPDVRNFGDMTKLDAYIELGGAEAPDVFVAGTPCQAFSVAGLRKGLEDKRGQLTIAYVETANAIDRVRVEDGKPETVCVWENVPGVLTSKDNAFGCFLAALAGELEDLVPSERPDPGRSSKFWRWDKKNSTHSPRWPNAGCVFGPQRAIAWRVLDAQYFGVAQRRRRVFLVASAREGFNPAEVLFEFDGVRRDSPPSREAGESFTHDVAPCLTGSGRGIDRTGDTRGQDPVVAAFRMVAFGEYSEDGTASTMKARDYKDHTDLAVTVVHGTQDPCVSNDVAFALGRNNGGENAVMAYAFAENSRAELRLENGDGQIAGALSTGGGKAGQGTPMIAFSCKDYGGDATEGLAPTLRAMGHSESHANAGGQLAVCITGDVTHTLKAEGFDGSEDGTGRGVPITPAIAVRTAQTGSNGWGVNEHTAYTLDCAQGQAVATNMAVRRLTPVECARLQGFPDKHCQIPWRGKPADQCPDGPQYKAYGNSKAIPCVQFVGLRIEAALQNPWKTGDL